MKPSLTVLIAAIAGILCGLVCTYPAQLGPIPSIIIWTAGGILVGLLVRGSRIILPGIVYGVVLSFVFLLSRFGGSLSKLPKYLLFVSAMSIAGAIGGVVSAFIGSKLRRP